MTHFTKIMIAAGMTLTFAALGCDDGGGGSSTTGSDGGGGSGGSSAGGGGSGGSSAGGGGSSTGGSSTGGSSTGGSSTGGSSTGGAGGAGGGSGGLPAGCWAGTAECNPLDNSPCGAGEACDVNQDGSLICFPPPNEAGEGEMCDNMSGPYCMGGFSCGPNNTCAKFCCSDADCGGGACAAIDETQGTLGLCQ